MGRTTSKHKDKMKTASKTTKKPSEPNLDAAPSAETPANGKGEAGTKEKPATKTVETKGNLVVETGPPKGFKFTPSERPVEEIVAEKVTFAPNHVGVLVKEGTTLEEVVPMIDYFARLGEHIGFFVGDVMVYARNTFKERVDWAMEATGRAASTVKNFETVSRAVPIDVRSAKLDWSHHLVVARLEDKKVIKSVLQAAEPKENSKGVQTKARMTVRELRTKVEKEFPKPKKAAKPMKDKKKTAAKPKKDVVFYKPTDEEQAAIDAFFEEIAKPLTTITTPLTKNGKHMGDIFVKMEFAAKKGLCSVLKPFADLYNRVSFKMGYGH